MKIPEEVVVAAGHDRRVCSIPAALNTQFDKARIFIGGVN